jgi:DNA primase
MPGYIKQSFIDSLLDRAHIDQVINNFLPADNKLKTAGANLKAKSPFNEDRTASLMVSPAKSIWKDFSSGKGGNLVNFVMETTPNGNVLMFWDNDRNSFTYYSDTSIPYRYLEVVARKYVIINNCREIYYIMEDQLKPLKKEEEKEKEEKEEKNVFAKLKSYNQSSIMNTKTIPSKKQNLSTHLPRIQINQKEENKNEILLKENANRYSYEGKLINFSFLKKPKKNMNEKISFSEFKKLQNSKK